ncbi:Unknown protein sequence [Pseudomonas caricapapayae]|nr:Unknown protein sequence [Pseudomonas caricapapayae]
MQPEPSGGLWLDCDSCRGFARRGAGGEAVLCSWGLASGQGSMKRLQSRVRHGKRQQHIHLPPSGYTELINGHDPETAGRSTAREGAQNGLGRSSDQSTLRRKADGPRHHGVD